MANDSENPSSPAGSNNPSNDELFDSPEAREDKTKDSETEEDVVVNELINGTPINDFQSESSELWGKQTENDLHGKRKFTGDEPETSRPAGQNRGPVMTGAGLNNLGNCCFMNAVLQCITHTVPFVRGVFSDKHTPRFECYKDFCVQCTLRNLVKVSLNPINKVVGANGLFHNLSNISSSFRTNQQEDAHEFLQCFLDKLESWQNSNQRESDNLVQKVFGGRLVSKLKCCNCGHCSNTYEPSIDLSLEIEHADNLLTALESFTNVEKIDDPDFKFTCEHCKKQVIIEKQLAFDKAPSVAVFHLKRFKSHGRYVQKIDRHVAFPLDFDLRPFTSIGQENNAEQKYVLYAIIVHSGLTATFGHYYCFIRLSPNMWFKFNDEEVDLVHEDFVLSQEAYILFYAKEGTSWFSSFIATQRFCRQN